MDIQFGTETEIGITREKPDGLDVVAESIALVRSATAPGVRMCWDYSCEDPHCDARGFRVKELLQDIDEANYFAQDAQRTLTFNEIKSDLVLRNGARFYNDHAHPEYCTPECSTLLELLQQDYSGDAVLMACAKGHQPGHHRLLRHSPNLLRGRQVWLGGRGQIPPARLSDFAAGRFLFRTAKRGHDATAADRQHAR